MFLFKVLISPSSKSQWAPTYPGTLPLHIAELGAFTKRPLIRRKRVVLEKLSAPTAFRSQFVVVLVLEVYHVAEEPHSVCKDVLGAIMCVMRAQNQDREVWCKCKLCIVSVTFILASEKR